MVVINVLNYISDGEVLASVSKCRFQFGKKYRGTTEITDSNHDPKIKTPPCGSVLQEAKSLQMTTVAWP